MWLLPTRGRPALAQRFLDGCVATGMADPGIIIACATSPGEYDGLRYASNWQYLASPMGMGDTMRYVYENFPEAPFYGWVADDYVPETPYWDALMHDAAGPWGLATCQDMYLANDPNNPLARSLNLCGAMCWGGPLVRAVGWWALPEVRQAGIDDAWAEIMRHCGGVNFQENIVMRHDNWRTGRRPKDETDEWVRQGEAFVAADFKVYEAWRARGGHVHAAARIVEAKSKARG